MNSGPTCNRYLISVHRPELWITSGVLFVLLLLLIIWFAFDFGRYKAGFNIAETDQYAQELEAKITQLTDQKNDLHRENSKLNLSHNIDRDASSKVNETLTETQNKMLEMKEELLFYRNVMEPGKSKRSVQIKTLQLRPKQANEYQYKFQLIQTGRHDVVARGVIEISIEGKDSKGKTIRLAMKSIVTDKMENKKKFGFKYFQNFEGGIKIPEDFVPILMYVRVVPKGSKIPKVDKSFVWADILNVGDQVNVGQIEN